MLKKGEHLEGTPAELQVQPNQEPVAMEFFESLSKSYKQGYCDWVDQTGGYP
jgi:Bacteriocin-protection, YdeI or OmpD-Associated